MKTKITYTQESFEEILEEAYEMLEPQDIQSLLLEAKSYIIAENNKNGFIYDVCSTVVKRRNISFKQWKAISAYVNGKRREENNKNNKTF
jgi:hypothetical protein